MAVKRKENLVFCPVAALSHTLTKNKKPEFTVDTEAEWMGLQEQGKDLSKDMLFHCLAHKNK